MQQKRGAIPFPEPIKLHSYQVEKVDIVGATITGVLWDDEGFLDTISIKKDGVKYELQSEDGDPETNGSAIALLQLTDQEGSGGPRPDTIEVDNANPRAL
jgi:hypothetical protein